MIAPDYGIKVKSFVGTYHIEKYDDIEYIVSEECYPAYEGEKELREKTLFIEDFKKNDYLLLALTNVDISKDEEIIAYCNEYGLPVSSISKNADTRILESVPVANMAETEEGYSEQLIRHDNIPKEEFCKYVISMKNIVNLKNGIDNEKYDIEMLSSLVYILLFNNIWKWNFKEDEQIPETITGQFSYLIQSYFQPDLSKRITNLKQNNDMIDVSRIAESLTKIYYVILVSMDIILNADKSDVPFIHDLADFLLNEFISKNKIQYISVDSNYRVEISEELDISPDMINLMKNIAPRVLADIITAGVKEVRPILSINENGEYYADWNFTHQYEGSFMELFLMCSSVDLQVRKCKHCTCEKFFLQIYDIIKYIALMNVLLLLLKKGNVTETETIRIEQDCHLVFKTELKR